MPDSENRIPTETVMSDWASGDNRILDAEEVERIRYLDANEVACEDEIIRLTASHEALRAALATAEAERDTWKAYAARVAQEARDDFGAFEAAVERVSVLEAALREAKEFIGNLPGTPEGVELLRLIDRVARAVLAVPEGDARHGSVPDEETPAE